MSRRGNLEIRTKLEHAISEVAAAGEALGAIMGSLEPGLRAEKVTVTAAVEKAFVRLRSARKELARLRELVEDEEITDAGQKRKPK